MVENLFVITEEIYELITNCKSSIQAKKLKTQSELLVKFNCCIKEICNGISFEQYDKFYFPLAINYYDNKEVEQGSTQKQDLDLTQEFEWFLNKSEENCKIFALFGGANSGKSIATKKIVYMLWQKFVEENYFRFKQGLDLDEKSWFSFYIDCSVFNQKRSLINNCVDDILKIQYWKIRKKIICKHQ